MWCLGVGVFVCGVCVCLCGCVYACAWVFVCVCVCTYVCGWVFHKKFCFKYRRPRPDFPEDFGIAISVDDAGLEVGRLDGVVAAVGNRIGVNPVVHVDAVAGDPTVANTLAAGVRTLCRNS